MILNICELYPCLDQSKDSQIRKKCLGEQALHLLSSTSADRLVALRRIVHVMQTLLARFMVMRAMSLLSVRFV